MNDELQRLAGTVPSRPAGDLDDPQMLAKAKGSLHWNLTVTHVGQIGPGMLRLSMSAPRIETMEWQPAQDLTVLITHAAGRDIRRRYTIAGHERDRVHLDVYIHGEGIGTTWARTCRPGDSVSAIGPRGKLVVKPDADWHVMVGDETSLPGIRMMLAATDRPAQVVVEVNDPLDWRALGVDARPATRWTWLPRGSPLNAAAVLALPSLGVGHAYISGEAQKVLVWREQLELLGLDPSAISHKAYWGTGRANATHGEPLG